MGTIDTMIYDEVARHFDDADVKVLFERNEEHRLYKLTVNLDFGQTECAMCSSSIAFDDISDAGSYQQMDAIVSRTAKLIIAELKRFYVRK